MPFPADDSLCERCGYALRGCPQKGTCPECGKPIADSDPVHRPGLPWQNRRSLRTLARTVAIMTFTPSRGYRMMRMDGKRWPDRAYLLLFCVLAGVVWQALYSWKVSHGTGLFVFAIAPLAAAMTYIEAAGVVYFSRREGWPVSWATAERVCCYAAAGWVPAAVLGVLLVLNRDELARWMPRIPWVQTEQVVQLAGLLLAGVCAMGFETLVWLGVRKVRYANRPSAEPVA